MSVVVSEVRHKNTVQHYGLNTLHPLPFLILPKMWSFVMPIYNYDIPVVLFYFPCKIQNLTFMMLLCFFMQFNVLIASHKILSTLHQMF